MSEALRLNPHIGAVIAARLRLIAQGDGDAIPISERRFGPHFEKPCRNGDTIICAAPECQAAYTCCYGRRKGRPA